MIETYRELLIGCGIARKKLMGKKSAGPEPEWSTLITLDIESDVHPDLVCDLDRMTWVAAGLTTRGEAAIDPTDDSALPYRPLKSDYFDEVHAYDVLHLLGRQGQLGTFFATFAEIYRVLKPGGMLFGTVPSRYQPWADPGQRRHIGGEALSYLDRAQVARNLKRVPAPMSDYRKSWAGDFEVHAAEDNHVRLLFGLKAHKPIRNL